MNAAPVKVLHYVASLRGGAAVCALELARRLGAEGFECCLAAPFDNPAWVGKENALGAPVRECRSRASLKRILAEERPALLHCHGHRAAMTGRLVRTSAKVVVTYHGFHVPHYRTWAARWLGRTWERWALHRTAAAIFVSEEDRRVAQAWLGRKGSSSIPPFRVVYNGIDVERFRRGRDHPRARAELGLLENDFVVGYVGRYHRQKSPGTLVSALARLQGSLPNVRLLMVGDGPLEGELKRATQREGVAERVEWLAPQGDLERLYPCLDVLVLPSLWEGLPLVLLEAGAAGLPVVASDAPGNREVVEHEATGLLFAPGQAGALSAALLRLVRDPLLARKLSDNLASRVGERFTVQRMVAETAALYRTVL